MGVDGISMLFVLLTTFLMPLCILASWDAITTRVKEYMIAFLVLETLMIGVFCALDLVLFYVFFEGGLIPMFLIIGIWGGAAARLCQLQVLPLHAAGSLLMLLAIMAMYWEAGTTDIPTLLTHAFPPSMQTWLWLAFLASFAVKMPMWPVHTWLPDAHVEAPTAGSVILAGMLLKMGGYGFLRFSLPMFPLASAEFAPLIFALSVIAIIYTSLVALAQEDMKKLIAYSSVAHMGFVTIGMFTLTMQGLPGRHLPDAVARHRLRRALPLRRRHLRPHAYARDRGLWRARRPHAALRLLLHGVHPGQCRAARHERLRRRVPERSLAPSASTPGSRSSPRSGIILSAAYALWLYRRVIFGALEKPSLQVHQGSDLARDRGHDSARRCSRSSSASIRRRCSMRPPPRSMP